eukprot:TRINITY_DN21591_c0_g1_i1.p1 TRINITY_DN21591_c0_g1~~TRINITY_DN21591_c0_g1_i1.p1  ORF type:complete len:2145 (-),score=331.07 TRINITY_DN21591_c0_g1_i1:592-6582(-)
MPAMFMTSSSALAWFMWAAGIFAEMAVLLSMVMIEPFTVDSFLFLFLFISVVVVEQFNPESRWRNWLLTIIACCAAILLPLRYAKLMPKVQNWIQGPSFPLSESEHPWLWQAFKLADTSMNARLKLLHLGVLLLLSASLHRIYCYSAQASLVGARAQVFLPGRPILMRIFLGLSRSSAAMLMFVSYFLMQKPDALSRLQLGGLICLLVSCQNWQYAGALISASSSVLLLAKYSSMFYQPAQADYWGLEWPGYYSEVALLLLGIVQRAVKRSEKHCTQNSPAAARLAENASLQLADLRKEIAGHSVQLAAVLLLLVALFCSNAWSPLHVGLVLLFLLSRDSSRQLTPSRASVWLLPLILTLACSFVFFSALQVWFPPGIATKPTGESLANSWLCHNFPNASAHLQEDSSCYLEAGTSCLDQRGLCGEAWAVWLGFEAPKSLGRGTTLSFITLFVMCLLRHLCLKEVRSAARMEALRSAAEAEHSDSLAPAVPSERPDGMQVHQAAQQHQSERQHALGQHEEEYEQQQKRESSVAGASIRRRISEALDDLQHKVYQHLPSLVYCVSAASLWLSLMFAALMQPRASLISLGYLLLFFWHLTTVEKVWDCQMPLRRRIHVLSWIRRFNLTVCLAVVIYQCPSVPCAFEIPLSTDCGESTCTTFFLSPAQCVEQQVNRSSRLDEFRKPLSALLQVLGVEKEAQGLRFSWGRFWQLMIFLSALIHTSAHERWSQEFEEAHSAQSNRLLLRERCYNQYLTKWRHLELSRIDTKHEVLLVKLQSVTGYIKRLRDIWSSKRGKLTAQERELQKRENRILTLCLESGMAPSMLEPIFDVFKTASTPAGPGISKDVRLSAESAIALEAARQDAEETVDACVLEHFQNLEQQKLRRITAHEAEDRRQELLRRCQEAGEVVQRVFQVSSGRDAPGAHPCTTREEVQAAVKEESAASSQGSASLEKPQEAMHPPERQISSAQEVLKSSRMSRIKSHIGRALRGVLGSLINDFLYTYDADDTLQSHRRNDGILQLLSKAFWSQTLPLLIICAFVQFALHMSVFASVTVCAIILSLMAFPYAPPWFWKVVIAYNLAVVVAKVLYQLPVFPISTDLDKVQALQQHGLSAAAGISPVPVPWEAVLGLLKVIPNATASSLVHDSAVEVAIQLRHRGLLPQSLLSALWTDLLCCCMLFCHYHTLVHSGRMGNPQEIRVSLSEGDHCESPTESARRARREEGTGLEEEEEAAQTEFRMEQEEDQQMNEEPEAAGGAKLKWLSSAQSRASKYFMQNFDFRRPPMDLYTSRFALMMCCFLLVILAWPSLVANTHAQGFAESFTSNSFSGGQVLAVVACLALLVESRAEYTWYTQYRWKRQTPARTYASEGTQDKARSSELEGERDGWRASHAVYLFQRILLLAQLVALHAMCISQWANDTVRSASITESDLLLLLFYILYMAYLGLTSLQLRYDVHVIRGGLGLTHNMDLLSSLAFKVYSAVPFAEEIRVLTDWTVTRTSLDFFQWMKLEDAQQGLYRTTRDMMMRRWYPPAAPRPASEKILQGGLLLLALMFLIVAPIAFFSSLNPSLQSNRLSSASLTGSLVVEGESAGVRQLKLYEAPQSRIELGNDRWNIDTARMDAVTVTFPAESEYIFDVSPGVQAHMSKMLHSPNTKAFFQVSYQFQFDAGESPGQPTSIQKRVYLQENTSANLAMLLNASRTLEDYNPLGKAFSVAVKNSLVPTVRVSSGMQITQAGQPKDVKLTFERTTDTLESLFERGVLGTWSMEQKCENVTTEGCPISLFVTAEKLAPVPVGGSGSSSWSVVGIYLGVVLTVGRFLRLNFQDAGKRVIYEELPDTSLLLDLCNGIYIARIQRLLNTEYKLYYQLMHIYRSPELLLDVTGKSFVGKLEDDEDLFPDGADRQQSGIDRPPGSADALRRPHGSVATSSDASGEPKGEKPFRFRPPPRLPAPAGDQHSFDKSQDAFDSTSEIETKSTGSPESDLRQRRNPQGHASSSTMEL